MAINTTPVFVGKVQNFIGQVSAANTNRDGTGTIVTLITGATDGTNIYSILLKAAVTTTAGMIRFYHNVSGTIRLIKEIPVAAITASASQDAWSDIWRSPDGGPIVSLKSGESLQASTHNAEAINIAGNWAGDFTS